MIPLILEWVEVNLELTRKHCVERFHIQPRLIIWAAIPLPSISISLRLQGVGGAAPKKCLKTMPFTWLYIQPTPFLTS